MLGPLLLTLLALLGALLPPALRLPDLPDAVPLALLVAGALWGWVAWTRRGGRARFAAVATQTLVGAALAYWMVGFSAYGEAGGAPRPGDPAPPFSAVRVRDGARFDLAAERGQQLLLVFFRGEW